MKYKPGEIVFLAGHEAYQKRLKPRFRHAPQPHWVIRFDEKYGRYEITDRQMFSPSMLVDESEIEKAPSPENA